MTAVPFDRRWDWRSARFLFGTDFPDPFRLTLVQQLFALNTSSASVLKAVDSQRSPTWTFYSPRWPGIGPTLERHLFPGPCLVSSYTLIRGFRPLWPPAKLIVIFIHWSKIWTYFKNYFNFMFILGFNV